MNHTLPLRVAIETAPPHRDSFVTLAREGDADAQWRVGDELPFEDRVVAVLLVGATAMSGTRAQRLQLMVECRRVLRPLGRLAIELPTTSSAVAALEDTASLARAAGLIRAAEGSLSFGVVDIKGNDSGSARASKWLELSKPERQLRGNPLVSICIPAYNPSFFEACIDSALAQTYDNLDIVIGDDSRGTEIEAAVKRRRGRPIHYVRNAQTLGTRGNFQRCFERCHGEFVKFLCDDDLLAPQCVAELLDGFRQAPDIALATSRRQRIDERGSPLPDQPATEPIVAADAVVCGTTLANAMLMMGLNRVGEPSTALFRRRDLLDEAPSYFKFLGEEGHGYIDLVTWTALLLKGDAVYRRDCLSSFRIHAAQRQHDPSKRERNVSSLRALQAIWLEIGYQDKVPADRLAVKPYPPAADDDWKLQPVLGLSARPLRDTDRASRQPQREGTANDLPASRAGEAS